MEFVKTINKLRLENKNNWYQFVGNVNGKQVRIKGYGTWLQIFTVDGIHHGGEMDIAVKRFKEVLYNAVSQPIMEQAR